MDDAEAHHLRVREQAVEVRSVAGVGGGEGAAVERGGGGVEQRELAAGLEVGEIDEQVGALGRREHEAVRRHADGSTEQAVVGADLGNPLELGRFVSEQHEPVGAGVGPVEHAKPVRGRLHVERRPHLAVDGRERRERLHHVGVGLVHELSGQPFLVVDVEVAVLNQQRQLERRSLRQLELALALVADDPEPGEPGVHVVLGDAHDVVVVPEQRRALIHRVVKDRGLTGREQVLRPAVVRRRGEAAVEVHDRVTGERGRVFVRRAAA